MKYSYLATKYKVCVDGLSIGSIRYPFVVKLKPATLEKLRKDVAHHYNVKPAGVEIQKVYGDARFDSFVWGEYFKIPMEGKVR